MSQQYPYGQPSPYSPPAGQYTPQPQPQLYPPVQGAGRGSRPSSPYQQLEPALAAQGWAGPGYAQQPQGYSSQGYPPPQYSPPPGYPSPQGYATQGYPPPNQGYQYAPPMPQPPPPQQQQGSGGGPYTLLFQPTSQKHTSSLTPVGSNTPTYIATYSRPLVYSSEPDIRVVATASGAQLATVNWHTWSSKIDLAFSSTGAQITYKDSFEPVGSSAAAATTTLGRLFWTLTHGTDKQADLKCADRTGATVCTVVLHDKLRSGRIEIWRPGLDKDLFDQVVVSALAEIEDWRRKVESQKTNNPAVMAGTMAAITSANN
ncbi:hypothetical protein AYL99_08163 [Fonsecaea erecta]|uniref:Uncharacterized protein n=1 Tax=Fonsecaea erecta TaxID=1367422 RepID=A0A178ZEE0_9EURO|nr:hypothetical protein AYL99_08163 [Fonsecaea erecta]OAP57425.1 hypothetical protein AYL99_08163 [Fonsecaea erecta]